MAVQHRLAFLLFLLIAGTVYVAATARLDRLPRLSDPRELDAVLPRSAQLAMAAGDRFLASNLATIRAVITDTYRMTPDQFALLGRIQNDAAWFNPANEDNYYAAANLLPWKGQFEAGQQVLRRAIDARPFDWLPVFYYAFDLWYFKHESQLAATWLKRAIPRADDENNRIALTVVAARWEGQGYDTATAIRLLQAQEKDVQHSRLKAFFRTRIVRLEGLLALEKATERFIKDHGKVPTNLDDLMQAGEIAALPEDPWHFGYALNASGHPILLNEPRKE